MPLQGLAKPQQLIQVERRVQPPRRLDTNVLRFLADPTGCMKPQSPKLVETLDMDQQLDVDQQLQAASAQASCMADMPLQCISAERSTTVQISAMTMPHFAQWTPGGAAEQLQQRQQPRQQQQQQQQQQPWQQPLLQDEQKHPQHTASFQTEHSSSKQHAPSTPSKLRLLTAQASNELCDELLAGFPAALGGDGCACCSIAPGSSVTAAAAAATAAAADLPAASAGCTVSAGDGAVDSPIVASSPTTTACHLSFGFCEDHNRFTHHAEGDALGKLVMLTGASMASSAHGDVQARSMLLHSKLSSAPVSPDPAPWPQPRVRRAPSLCEAPVAGGSLLSSQNCAQVDTSASCEGSITVQQWSRQHHAQLSYQAGAQYSWTDRQHLSHSSYLAMQPHPPAGQQDSSPALQGMATRCTSGGLAEHLASITVAPHAEASPPLCCLQRQLSSSPLLHQCACSVMESMPVVAQVSLATMQPHAKTPVASTAMALQFTSSSWSQTQSEHLQLQLQQMDSDMLVDGLQALDWCESDFADADMDIDGLLDELSA